MRSDEATRARERALRAGCDGGVVAWLGLYGFAWNDYEVEAQPAVNALVHGHLAEFLRLAPSYGGSLIVLVGLILPLALWLASRRSGRAIRTSDALLLLAVTLLLRCLLDTWDIGYYMLPFLLVLLTWEVLGPSRHAPLLTMAAVVLPWTVLAKLSAQRITPDVEAALFLAWTLPLAAGLGWRLFTSERPLSAPQVKETRISTLDHVPAALWTMPTPWPRHLSRDPLLPLLWPGHSERLGGGAELHDETVGVQG